MTQEKLLGTVRAQDGRATIRVEDVYPTSAEDLWSAVTDPARLARWLAQVEGDLTVGGTIRAEFTSGWEGVGRIEVCDAPHRLVVRFGPGSDDETRLEALLTPLDDAADGATDGAGGGTAGPRTRLVVEERGIPLPEATAHGAGWQAHVEDLAAHLADGPGPRWRDRWSELADVYREAFPAVRP